MSEEKTMRLSQVARKLNVGRTTIVDFLADKGFDVDSSPNSKVTGEQFAMLSKEFAASASEKEEASGLTIGTKHNEHVVIDSDGEEPKKSDDEEKVLIKNLSKGKDEVEDKPKEKEPSKPEKVDNDKPKLKGLNVVGKIDLQKKDKKEEPKAEAKKEEPKPKEEPKKEEKKPEPEVKKEEPPKKEEAPKEEKPKVEAKKEAPKETPKEQPKPVENKSEKAPKDKIEEKPKQVQKKEATPKPQEEKVEAKKEDSKNKSSEQPKRQEVIEAKADKLKGLKVVGKIELPVEKDKKKDKPVASSDDRKEQKKKKRPRKRIPRDNHHNNNNNNNNNNNRGRSKRPRVEKEEPSDKEIQDKIKATLAKLSGNKKKSSGSKYRREKRSALAEAKEEQMLQEEQESKILKVTEYISANDLASLMDVSVNDVISTCMGLGMFVSINQRLDAESITVIADEFGYNVEFTSSDDDLEIEVEEDADDDLKDRAPIVTIMGHVDHGKTSLLDYIRNSKVTAGEAGGITQHIGAYDVTTESGQKIAFLDTPGHEAFTAMRARGAQVTDIVIIVVAADDDVMPQTKEAINHAQVAGVPIVIAINKIDKPGANPDKVRESLSQNNILVEDWGGKYQSQEISAKTGQGVEDLLEKVLLEAELLELKANPDRKAVGAVIEASLDKGRGYVATLLVQNGTMQVGDVILAGAYHGRVKAMFDHKGTKMDKAGPSTPVLMLGLDGAPQAGDKFNVMDSDREAREIANKREQIQREQNIRTKKHITLDEIGRRLAIGSFKELNVIVKGDVDGSVEALSDSLLKLSTEEIQVNIIHKGVGQISESDVLLASASDAVIVGFQVRPSSSAKRIAENEEIEIRLYSVIYDAINDVKDAMEGMLDPEVEEVIVGNVEVRDVFKISKVGTVAGCMVTDGYIKRSNPIRLIRDGIVIYSGEMGQLKRYKDDVNEVRSGYECGISIKNFNDIKEGDIVESYEERETKRTL
ncbi:translation initiation factor IF-2 [Fulvivirga maritima]|uniref:translation initiation factor IF-2 n=1 Tax=Fulvivirga maritima TaxID=2904247 RepID=UPI001F031B8D|nr:translation initiation factor IF-2 [Fulvivirga maritima]UII28644.1 translation initiation factor IF-2 [Fulvivirga maritima]